MPPTTIAQQDPPLSSTDLTQAALDAALKAQQDATARYNEIQAELVAARKDDPNGFAAVDAAKRLDASAAQLNSANTDLANAYAKAAAASKSSSKPNALTAPATDKFLPDGVTPNPNYRDPSKPSAATAPASEKYLPDGVTPNPNYKDPSKPSAATAPSTAKFLPDGITPNPNYVPPRPPGASQTPEQAAASSAAADRSTAQAELSTVQADLTTIKIAEATEQDPQKLANLKAQEGVLQARANDLAAQAAKADAQTTKLQAPVAVTPDTVSATRTYLVPSDTAPTPDAVDMGNGWWQVSAPNDQQQTVSDQILGMYSSLAPMVKGGQISTDQAIKLLNAAATNMGYDVTQRSQDITEQDSQRSANATLIDSRARWGSQYAQQALQTIAAANQYAPPGADAAGAYLGALEMGQRFLAGLGGLNDPNSPVGGQTPGFMQAPLNGTPFQVPPRVGGTVGPAAGSSPAEVAAAAAHAATSAALQPSTPSANSGAPTPPDQTSSGPLLPPGVAGTAQDPRYAGAVPPSSLAPAAPLFSSLGFNPPQTPASPAGPGTSNGMPLHADGSPLATPADVARVFGRSSIGAQQ